MLPACSLNLASGAGSNKAPVAQSQSLEVSYNSTQTIDLTALDEEGDSLRYSLVSEPVHGTLSPVASEENSFVYTPESGFVGNDSFSFVASDTRSISNRAVVTINVSSTITIYLRESGDDALTLEPTNSSTPALTAQRAVDFAISRNPSSTHPIVIDVGTRSTGNFGDIVLTQHFGQDVTWRGVSRTSSVIGNVNASGHDGAPGDAASDDPSADGEHAGDGYNVTITSNGEVSFGSITANGGVGGGNYVGPEFNVGSGDGPRSGNGGNGGTIVLGEDVFTGEIAANGGLSGVDHTDFNRYGTEGNGGSVLIGSRAVVANISARGAGINLFPAQAGKAIGGSGGSVTVNGVASDIDVSGGGGYGYGGNGGGVVVNGRAGVVNANGQDSYYNGGNGGSVTVNGVTQDVYANGGDYVDTSGGTAGNITVGPSASTGSRFSEAGSVNP